jgi:hypothetical protein
MLDLDEFRRAQKGLAILKDAWASTPQGKGGLVALRGFHYQMATTLLAVLRVWVGKEKTERNRPELLRISIEALSDWTEQTRTAVVACQAKRGRTSQSVKDALKEFWLIERLASERTPELAAFLEYRIISPLIDSEEARRIIAQWSPEGDIASDAFKGKVTTRVEPDPEIELLALLANTFGAEDPLGTIKRWLGDLFRGAELGIGFNEALTSIWNDLQTLEAKDQVRRPPGYLWTVRDRMPDSPREGNVLNGQRPMVHQLREGFFADRPAIYGRLLNSAEHWISHCTLRGNGAAKLGFFWIEGRSGTGKSVALLNLLARLHERGHELIIWLGDKITLLPQAVRWSRPLLREHRSVIIAIDDPYDPMNQAETKALLDAADVELLVLRQEFPDATQPLIFCCGPTEQRTRFGKDFTELVEIETVEIPKETREELKELWAWYCIRSGTTRQIPYSADADVLMVQLFFEWRVDQKLPDFASRLRKRIAAMDGVADGPLQQFVSRMLALNRLYVGYPFGAAEELCRHPKFEAAFRRLKEEEHHLELNEPSHSFGIRLAHPHLANAIYEVWFNSDEDEPYRREHLHAGIFDAITHGTGPKEKTAPLWAIARLGNDQSDAELRNRISSKSLKALLVGVYPELRARLTENLPPWILPVWIEISARFSSVRFTPSPVDDATRHLHGDPVEEPGLRLTCHKLLQHFETFPLAVKAQVAEAIVAFLTARSGWREWAPVAADYCLRTGRSDLMLQIELWLTEHIRHPLASYLLRAVLGVTNDRELQHKAQAWLMTYGNDQPGWVRVWEKLLGAVGRDEVLNNWGVEWIQRASIDNASWGFVWLALARLRPDDHDLIARGRRWLSDVTPDNPSWSFVWQSLAKIDSEDNDLTARGLRWLDEVTPNHDSWTHVWEDLLLRRFENDVRDIVSRGRKWLDDIAPDNPSWGFVWQSLLEHCPHDEDLFERGLGWLDEVDPHHASWTHVWGRLYKVQPKSKDIVACGKRWLDEAGLDSPSYAFVWWRLARGEPENIDLLDRGRRFVETVDCRNRSWALVMARLVKAYPDDHQLFANACQLLETQLDHKGWKDLWQGVHKLRPYDERINQLGFDWIRQCSDSEGWTQVWNALFRTYPKNQWLIDSGRQRLLEFNRAQESWIQIWHALFKASPKDKDLLQYGTEWLDLASVGDGSWVGVWRALVKSGYDPDHLARRGLQWLDVADHTHGSWGYVWFNLMQILKEDEAFLDRGVLWLKRADPCQASWGHVWHALYRARPDRLLLDRGRTWLEQVGPKAGFWGHVWQCCIEATPKDETFVETWALMARTNKLGPPFSADCFGHAEVVCMISQGVNA